LILPILTDLYPSETFGVQAVFMAVVQTVAIGANGGYDQAIMLPQAEGDARALFRLSQWLNLGIVLMITLLLLGVGEWFWHQMEVNALGLWQWLLPLSLWLEGSMKPLRVMHNRRGAYHILTSSKLVQAIGSGGLMLLLGWQGWGIAGLLLGWTIGMLLGWLVLMGTYWIAVVRAPEPQVSLRLMALTYRDFPLKSMGSSWLNTFSRQLPFYLLPIFFGQMVNGYYFMAHRALMLPMSLVSGAIGEVFFRQAALRKQQGASAVIALARRTALQLAALGSIPLVVMMLAGPWIAAIALGPDWETAGSYARWLMPWVFMTFVASPMTCLTDIYRRLEAELGYNVLLLITRGGTLLLGGYVLTAQQTIIGYAIGGSLMMGGYLWFLFDMVRAEAAREALMES
jgi:O-antigen/teichoic acid export membrane protein